jgi:hypothetical protein
MVQGGPIYRTEEGIVDFEILVLPDEPFGILVPECLECTDSMTPPKIGYIRQDMVPFDTIPWETTILGISNIGV